MDFDYRNFPNRLNLGCGFDIKQGYLNVDFQAFHKPDLVADIRCLDMLPSDFYEEIYAQDCLEHIPRGQTEATLLEWYRLLKSGGVFILRVPNMIGLLRLFESDEYGTCEKQQHLIQCMFGTQAYEGDYHYTGFTENLARHYLEKAGFTVLSIDPYSWLLNITAQKNA